VDTHRAANFAAFGDAERDLDANHNADTDANDNADASAFLYVDA
jgi:hypothetical protein